MGIKWTQIGQHIDVHQAQLMVLIRLVLLDQDPLPWNSEVDSDEDKQNKYDVSFTTRRWRSYNIFFFDSKIHLFKKRKRIKYSKIKKKKKKKKKKIEKGKKKKKKKKKK